MAIVDPAAAVAREVRRRLGESRLLTRGHRGEHGGAVERDSEGMTFWTSGNPGVAEDVLRVLWPGGPAVQALPSAYAEAASR